MTTRQQNLHASAQAAGLILTRHNHGSERHPRWVYTLAKPVATSLREMDIRDWIVSHSVRLHVAKTTEDQAS